MALQERNPLLWLWVWLGPPRFHDEEGVRVGRAVRLLAATLIAGAIPPLLVHWQHRWWEEFWTLCAVALALLGTLWLNHRGHTQWAALVLTLSGLAGSAGMIYFGGDAYRDPSLLLFPVILAIAALLLSWRFYVGLSVSVVLAPAAVILLQIHGLNPYASQARGTYLDLLMVMIVLTLTSVAVGLLAGALRRSLVNYRKLIQQQGEGVVVLDDQRRIRMANPSATEIFGLPVERLLGRSIQDFISSEEWLAIEPEAARCRGGERVSFEFTGERPDGTRRRLLATWTPRLGEDGKWSGSIALLRDVTEAREADAKMRLLAQALRSTDNCVCIADVMDRIVYVNDAFLHTYGYSESELLGQPVGMVRSPRNPPGLAERILPATLEDGWSGELWDRAKDGREFLVSLTASAVRDERGRVIATVDVSRDLSQRKAVEQALQESERRFREILNHVSLAALMLDLEGNITFPNDLLLTALGRPRDEVVGRPAIEFLAPEYHDQHRWRLREALQFGVVEQSAESAVLGSDGRRRWFQWAITALRRPDGGLEGFAALGFDVTDQRALREQFLQAQKLESIGRLAGGVAHDFNNLLTVINGFGEIVLNRLEAGSPLRPHLEQVLAAGQQAAALTRQLLAFSRKQASQPRPLDLNQVIREATKLLGRVLGEHIQLDSQLSPSLGPVMADPTQMHQVLMNLAVNAGDAMSGGGTLTLTSANVEVGPESAGRHSGVPPGSYVCLEVADTGAGMTEEVRSHIFEPFFTTKESGKGTGLGLATVYGIVRQSGGWIRVWSEPGRGSAFYLYLPRIMEPEGADTDDATPLAGLLGSETILLVEDQDAVLHVVTAALEAYGYQVLTAASGLAALALADQFPGPIHLLLTDVVMPGMDGRVLAGKLKAVRPGIRVLFMSGYAGETLAADGLPDPSITFIPKPLRPGLLAAKVRETLELA